jgi:hypothetical protein
MKPDRTNEFYPEQENALDGVHEKRYRRGMGILR